MRRIGDKRGIEMVMTTVIMIILSIAALSVLMLFFNSQTGALSKWFMTNSEKSNVDLVISSCNSLITTESIYSYCCDIKEVRLENGVSKKLTCYNVSLEEFNDGRVEELYCGTTTCVGK